MNRERGSKKLGVFLSVVLNSFPMIGGTEGGGGEGARGWKVSDIKMEGDIRRTKKRRMRGRRRRKVKDFSEIVVRFYASLACSFHERQVPIC